MATLFVILVSLHALIHLMGTVKAFAPASLPAFKAPVSPASGILWFISFLAMAAVAVSYATDLAWWWLLAGLSALWSQLCIVLFWREARYGTLPNAIILTVALVSYAAHQFDAHVQSDWDTLRVHDDVAESEILTLAMTEGMPLSVQRWLVRSGAVGRPLARGADLQQHFNLKLTPEQEDWYEGHARQRINVVNQAFVWDLEMSMWPGIAIRGRDQLRGGQGEMTIRAFGAVPVVTESHNDRINEATLQRYLGELVWVPSGVLHGDISWTYIDNRSAQATLTVGDVAATGIFAFDENSDIQSFTAMRYMDSDADAKPVPWVVEARKVELRNGVRIPTVATATWQLDEGDWTWAEVEVGDITFW